MIEYIILAVIISSFLLFLLTFFLEWLLTRNNYHSYISDFIMNRKYIKYANKNNNKNNSKNNIKKDIVKQESLFPEIAQENDELFDIDAVPFNEVVEEKVDNFSNDNVIELAIEDENVDLENLDFTLIIEKKVNLKI